jgi:hypothetical protein
MPGRTYPSSAKRAAGAFPCAIQGASKMIELALAQEIQLLREIPLYGCL